MDVNKFRPEFPFQSSPPRDYDSERCTCSKTIKKQLREGKRGGETKTEKDDTADMRQTDNGDAERG